MVCLPSSFFVEKKQTAKLLHQSILIPSFLSLGNLIGGPYTPLYENSVSLPKNNDDESH